MEQMIDKFKLNGNNEDIDSKIKLLIDKHFISEFKVSSQE